MSALSILSSLMKKPYRGSVHQLALFNFEELKERGFLTLDYNKASGIAEAIITDNGIEYFLSN